MDSVSGERPAPRPFRYPFCDFTKGEFQLPFGSPPPLGPGVGDYRGSGWTPLGITGYEVRVWYPASAPGVLGDIPVLQYRATGGPDSFFGPVSPIEPVPLDEPLT